MATLSELADSIGYTDGFESQSECPSSQVVRAATAVGEAAATGQSAAASRRDPIGSEPMNADQALASHLASLPVPAFDDPAFVHPPPLSETTVGVVTTATLHHPEDSGFGPNEQSFRRIDIVLSRRSDRSARAPWVRSATGGRRCVSHGTSRAGRGHRERLPARGAMAVSVQRSRRSPGDVGSPSARSPRSRAAATAAAAPATSTTG